MVDGRATEWSVSALKQTGYHGCTMATKKISKKTTKKPARKASKKAPSKKSPAKKPTAKKTTARKVAKKPAAKKVAASKPAAAAKKLAVKAKQGVSPEHRQAVAPLYLVEPGESYEHWTLCLADSESPIDLFEEEGHSGNGYAWDSVARIAMKGLADGLARGIDFNSEGGTFVAESTELAALLELGRALAAMLRDQESLRVAIRAVPEDDWDD
jgi:hypothetical protein